MGIANVKVTRGLPFLKRGMKVYHHHNKRFGVITSGNDSRNINVRFDGDKFSVNCHPKWQIKYFDTDGKILADFHD